MTWIKTTERLPKPDKEVWVFVADDKTVHKGKYIEDASMGCGQMIVSGHEPKYAFSKITHWTPKLHGYLMPEGPEEVKRG